MSSSWPKSPGHQRSPGSALVFSGETHSRCSHTCCLGNQSPSTSGFSSCRSSVQHCDRCLPKQSSSRKKFTPRSASSTTLSSTMVKRPIPVAWLVSFPIHQQSWRGMTWHGVPGSTRFLRVSTPTVPGPELRRRILADSSAAWPLAAHRRSWRSYFFSFSDGPCSMGGVWLITISVMVKGFCREQKAGLG